MFKNREYKNYLLYAFGEIVLVILGILIALQINNWNSERRDRAALQSYLGSIARNMSHDLKALEKLSARREANYLYAIGSANMTGRQFLRVQEVDALSNALERASELKYFNPNTSGYEALKSSGFLGNLQGTDVEGLLFEYYDTVDRISKIESDHNAMVRDMRLQLLREFPDELEDWEFASADSLTPERFHQLQPAFYQLVNSGVYIGLQVSVLKFGTLLGEYDKAIKMSRAFVHLAASGSLAFDDIALDTLKSIHDPSTGAGNPIILQQGRFPLHNLDLSLVDSTLRGMVGFAENAELAGSWNYQALQRVNDSLQVFYPGGAHWAVLSLSVRDMDDIAGRAPADYSMYEKLQLEIKGVRDGETILVNLKDSDDPDDGSQTNVELSLGTEWQTYEINLDRFDNADLQKLHVVLAFLFFDRPQTFFIRSARFI